MEVREPSAKYLARPAYKQTEVGLIPQDWIVQTIGEICAISAGGDLVRSEFSSDYDDRYPYPIYANALSFKGLYGYSKTFRYIEDSLTVTARGDVGHAAHRTSKFSAIGRLLVLSAKQTCDLRFLCEYINTRVDFALESTGVPQLTAPQIAGYLVARPPTLVEQQAIAEALSDADALIESLEQLLAKKRQIKQGAMQELLTGQKRLPGFAGEWEQKQLDELGRWVGGMTPSMSNTSYWTPAEIPWISSGDMKVARLFSTAFAISEHAVKERATTVIPERSIVVVMRSGILRNYLPVAMTMLPMAINQDVKAILPIRGVSPEYLLHALVGNGDRILSRCLKSGTTVESIEFRWLKAFGIPLPSIEEQTAIATVLSDMDAELAALEAKLAKARDLKLGMMQELLTGRIRLVQSKADVIPFPEQIGAVPEKSRPHNRQIEEAVMLGVLAKTFGSEQHPLARVRRTKLLYLLHRHVDGSAEGYLKKAAGPYNPKTRYQGAEGIALKNEYVRAHHNGTYEGFVAGDKVAGAEAYFDKWHGPAVRAWLEQFHYTKTDELELLATVDMAMEDLRRAGNSVALAGVKQVIQSHPEWQAKLDRPIFSDTNIERAIAECHNLFGN